VSLAIFALLLAACSSPKPQGGGGAPKATDGGGAGGAGGGAAGRAGGAPGGSSGHAGAGGAHAGGSSGSAGALPVIDVFGEVITRLPNGHFALAGPMYDVSTRKVTGAGFAEITEAGEEVWSRSTFGPCMNDVATNTNTCPDFLQVHASASGNIFVAGLTRVALPGTTATGGGHFVAGLDATGNYVWGREIQSVISSLLARSGLAGDDGSGSLRAELGVTELSNMDQLSRFAPDGSAIWTTPLEGSQNALLSYWAGVTDKLGTTYLFVERNLYGRTPPGDSLEMQRIDKDGHVLPTWPIPGGACSLTTGIQSFSDWSMKLNPGGTAMYVAGFDCVMKIDASTGAVIYNVAIPMTRKMKQNCGDCLGWHIVVSADDSALYMYTSSNDGSLVQRIAAADGSVVWQKPVTYPPSLVANGSEIEVDASNEKLFILVYGQPSGLAAMPTSGATDPVRVLNFVK
jgi:hypothetical protein